jgi:hypothetical protein
MIWVTWRQHRIEALIAGILLATLMLALLITGIEMISTYQNTGLASCTIPQPMCDILELNFINHYSTVVSFMAIALSSLPLLAGMFIGAPLVARELEHRTHRLIWTQSITRIRWLGTKLLLITSITLAAFITLTALTAWWSGPWNAVNSPWSTYDLRGLVLPAYALFALALGIAAGTLVRQSVPAIGITLVVFLLVRFAIAFWLRPYFLTPLTYISSLDQPGPPSHVDWTVHNGTIDRSGREISISEISQICPQLVGKGSANDFSAFRTCEQEHGFQSRSFYQPVDRFWLFQVIEATIFLLMAVALFTSSVWLTSKKIT